MILAICARVSHLFKKISEYLGIHWAPLNVPLERRLQTLFMVIDICILIFGEILSIIAIIYLLYSDFWLIGIIYIMWLLNDTEVYKNGGRQCEWVKNWSIWNYTRDYFPVKLVKTVELDPTKNYLFACFPHGVFGIGTILTFTTNALGFKKIFPGLTINAVTLRGHFIIPFFRDLVLALGICVSSQESLLHLLNLKNYRGKCVAIVIGGADEALESKYGEYRLNVKKRKGFVRVAMIAGAPLVPVFFFGEVDTFEQISNPEGSLLRRFQVFVKRYIGLPPVLINGRGIFQYSYGLMPKRAPITTVVGAPMEVKKNLEPTQEEIDQVHAEFVRRLEELFESEKSKYLEDHENKHLIFY